MEREAGASAGNLPRPLRKPLTLGDSQCSQLSGRKHTVRDLLSGFVPMQSHEV